MWAQELTRIWKLQESKLLEQNLPMHGIGSRAQESSREKQELAYGIRSRASATWCCMLSNIGSGYKWEYSGEKLEEVALIFGSATSFQWEWQQEKRKSVSTGLG